MTVISEDHCSIRYVRDQYKTQKMCDEAVDCYLTALKFVPDRYKTPTMYIRVIYEDPFSIRYVLDQCKSR